MDELDFGDKDYEIERDVMRFPFSASLAILAATTACGSPLSNTSNYLEQTTAADTVLGSGAVCFLSTDDQPDDYVRLIARDNEAVVRVNDAPVHLSYEGQNLRGGGIFRSGPLTVEIAGIPERAARSSERIGEMSIVTVRDRAHYEQFSALWVC